MYSRPFLLSILVATLAIGALSSCQTTAPAVAAPAANWSTHLGQMHFTSTAGRSVIGEFVARRSPDSRGFQLQFSSGPGFPLLKLSVSGEDVVAEGLFARGRWHGRVSAAPPTLRNWVQLREVFAQMDSRGGSPGGSGWTAEVRNSEGRKEGMTVQFAEGGERFAFRFSR